MSDGIKILLPALPETSNWLGLGQVPVQVLVPKVKLGIRHWQKEATSLATASNPAFVTRTAVPVTPPTSTPLGLVAILLGRIVMQTSNLKLVDLCLPTTGLRIPELPMETIPLSDLVNPETNGSNSLPAQGLGNPRWATD